MAFIGTFSRSLLESATAIYFGGVPVHLMDAQGNVLLGEGLPDAPTITSTIADRIYATSDAPATVDLRTKFDGATSYTVSPANAAVSITDYTLTISPTAPMSQTTFTVRGINGGGASEPLTFKLTVNAPTPVLDQPFPDQSLLIGGGSVTLPLAEYFSGAATYAVSPANAGVTISNGNLVISRSTARDVIVTVTATNATGQDTSDSFALLIGAPVNQAPVASAIPEQGPVANVAFTVDLSGYFEDPDGDPLIFDYTGTLPTGITRVGAVFSGTATVTGQTASGTLRARDPGNLEAEAPVTWAVAAQPAITATITPSTLIAGEDFEVLFNVEPDSVSPSSLIRDGVNLRLYRGAAPDSGTIAIGATKTGHTAYARTLTYAPKPVAQTGTINTESDGTISITVPDDAAPFSVSIGGEAVTIDPALFTASGQPVVLDAPDIAGQGGNGETLTVTDRALFGRHASAGPITISAGWYRGETATGDTDGSYTQIDTLDGDKTITFRETAGATVAISNGILCPAPAQASWWNPLVDANPGSIHLDYANSRFRIGGNTYTSLEAAKAANAIKTAGGVDYVDIPSIAATFSMAATGIVPNDGTLRSIAAVDDGTANNGAYMGQYTGSSTHKYHYGANAGGANAVSFPISPTLVPGNPIRIALRARGGVNGWRRVAEGVGVNGSSQVNVPTGLNRLVIGNRSPGDRPWTGAIYQIVYINADLNDAQVDALLGAA